MACNAAKYREIREELGKTVQLVAVSKLKPVEDIQALYELGQRDFGENYVQELVTKQALLPKDIRWHFIGHLQSNKVKQLAPFVHLIQGVDSLRLLQEIDKQAQRQGRPIHCLLQVHIAAEETKFGFDEKELDGVMSEIRNGMGIDAGGSDGKPPAGGSIRVIGLMGMASLSDDPDLARKEFGRLKALFDKYFPAAPAVLSMGMSGDYKIAVEEGSNMVRIGSLLFGTRGG
jgi:uncharacterized pyridoxal phosphate-containing UPF0001 family protein